ncbi:MAG: ATP-binding cassette domain-containing protein [Candidatus Riflebacteria bacterium]|nr:ATP-binding cassette domain-containing protein [Candidatus Riflebacteria bacterium]
MRYEDGDIAIRTEQLLKTFNVRQKKQGITASLKNFIKPVYKEIHAVNSLSMEIKSGEIVGFLGPNGAGKTTTLKMLSGLLVPTSGSISVKGFDPFERNPEYLKQISLVMGQKQNLWWDLPPADTFEIHKSMYSIPDDEYKTIRDTLVDMLEISDCLETQARKLSLGQRMRCELALSLLHKPSILFLDEPTIGLDIIMQKKIRKFLAEYHKIYSPTILLTSHYMDDVEALAERVIVINHGRKVYDGSIDSLTGTWKDTKTVSLFLECDNPPESLIAKYQPTAKEGHLFKFSVKTHEMGDFMNSVYSSCEVSDLSVESVELEEIIGELFMMQSEETELRENA